MIASEARISEKTKSVFSNLISAGESALGISSFDMTSKSRTKKLVDARRMMYHILRKQYKLSYAIIGRLFDKDHSTVVFLEKMHTHFIKTDVEYAKKFSYLMLHIQNRSYSDDSDMHAISNKILLKETRSSNDEKLGVILSCFDRHEDVAFFIRKNKVSKSSIIFCGYSSYMNDRLAQLSVELDQQSYFNGPENVGNSNEILMNVYPNVMYKNYSTGEFDVPNSALDSFKTAMECLGNKSIIMIYAIRSAPKDRQENP